VDVSAIQQMVRQALNSYRPPPGGRTLGQPFSEEKIASELKLLQAALIEPYLARIVVPDDERGRLARSGPYWVVARLSGDVVYYDEGANEFGLAQVGANGSMASVAVRGDVAGVFMAR
jgi:hypothetical protein